ncbi:MBL fold metallo-hydrolase [Candidatus Daviesbacteria bacterium]|nr:MBL fold metallo-hydrolase [Candidatus Daviesbacteria bacterium]
MDIYWYGQACFKIKGKNATIFIDPFKPDFTGLKLPKDMEADIALSTHDHDDHNNLEAVLSNPVKISGPGEYEAKGVSIIGIQVAHDGTGGLDRGKNTVYNIMVDGLNIVHLGDLGHKLSEDQVQEIGSTDILMAPVGGIYTVGAKEAEEIIVQLEPKIIIPMHYLIPGLKFELEGVEHFLKDMGEGSEPLPKLSITKDKLPEEPKVVVLNKS